MGEREERRGIMRWKGHTFAVPLLLLLLLFSQLRADRPPSMLMPVHLLPRGCAGRQDGIECEMKKWGGDGVFSAPCFPQQGFCSRLYYADIVSRWSGK